MITTQKILSENKILAYKRDYGINQQIGFLKIW